MDRFDNIPEQALDWHLAGRGAALATVIETWGSAPRRVGSQLAVSGTGEMAGSVSGGCVEGAVVTEALEALEDGGPRMLEFGVSDGDAFAVGLACGGTIRVLVQPVGEAFAPDLLQELVTARADRVAVALISDPEGRVIEVTQQGYPERFRMDRSGFEEDGRFVAVQQSAVAAGGGGSGAYRPGRWCPWPAPPDSTRWSSTRVTVSPAPTVSPDTRILSDWPDEAVAEIGLDARTALVLLTHDPKLDDPALEAALAGTCFYIGALGSSRTHAKRLDRMREKGFDEGQLARIHGPVAWTSAPPTPPRSPCRSWRRWCRS